MITRAITIAAFAALLAWEWLVTTQFAWRIGARWPWLRRQTLAVLDAEPERFVLKIEQAGPDGARVRFRRRARA